MKYLFICLVAALAICAFAAPTDDLPQDWPAPGTQVELEEASSTNDIETPSFYNGSLFDGTHDQAAAQWGAHLHVRLAGNKQNVGLYTDQRLYDEIHRCLMRVCGMAEGEGKDVCDPAPCHINHVAYVNSKGKIQYDTHLEVRVLEAAFPRRPGDQWRYLQRATLLQIAAYSYQAQTHQVTENCRNLKHTPHNLCNIGEFVSVNVGGTPGAGFVRVGIINSRQHPRPPGGYKCKAALIDIYEYIKREAELKLQNALSNWLWRYEVYCAE